MSQLPFPSLRHFIHIFTHSAPSFLFFPHQLTGVVPARHTRKTEGKSVLVLEEKKEGTLMIPLGQLEYHQSESLPWQACPS